MLHFEQDAVVSGFVNVVKADIRGQAQHGRDLAHIGADHAAGADDEKFFVREKTVGCHISSLYGLGCKDTNFICWM